jgi:hypothetical protein
MGCGAPTLREVVRLTYAMIDIYCGSYGRPPAAVTLDIDDTVDVVQTASCTASEVAMSSWLTMGSLHFTAAALPPHQLKSSGVAKARKPGRHPGWHRNVPVGVLTRKGGCGARTS